MPNVFHAQSEIAFAFQTGRSREEIQNQFNLTTEEYTKAAELYDAGNDLELTKLAQSKTILTSAVNTEEAETAATDIQPLPAPPKPTHGYKVRALKGNVFIKPLPKDHPGRLITPPAYETSANMGFVYNRGPEVSLRIKPGSLVLYDKFAETGSRYDLVVDGEITELVMIREEFILGILTRVKL